MHNHLLKKQTCCGSYKYKIDIVNKFMCLEERDVNEKKANHIKKYIKTWAQSQCHSLLHIFVVVVLFLFR